MNREGKAVPFAVTVRSLCYVSRLKGQLCNTLSNRLALRNGAPPLTEADRKAAEERLQKLRRDADNKRLAIKNLKLALERLDITEWVWDQATVIVIIEARYRESWLLIYRDILSRERP